MLRWLGGPEGDGFGNPHSSHRIGRQAAAAVEVAREQVAALFPPGGRVVFTGSATEAINLAIRGSEPGRAGAPMAISALEHSAVLHTVEAVSADVTVLSVDEEGLVAPQPNLPAGTGLVAVMQVNNEIGTVQPVDQIGEAAHRSGALFLCDAVQGAGKCDPPVNADMIAITGHKIYGPKGIGALWVRDGVALEPVLTGGGQEGDLRSGTLSPALCAGFGAAAQAMVDRRDEDSAHVEALWARARELFVDWALNGSATRRIHGNLSIRRAGLDVARLMSEVREVCFSAGSACASEAKVPSRILAALGLSREDARGSIRLGFGRYTTMEELERAAELLNAGAAAQGV
jgi:cysteine desulfurase